MLSSLIRKLAVLVVGTALGQAPALAGIPEPDSIVYGTASIGGLPLTSSNSTVVITARLGETLVANYTMGSNPQAGNQYLVRVPMDALGQRATDKARAGDVLTLYINGVQAGNLTLTDRGSVFRQDININDSSCNTTQSGPLLSKASFGGISACGVTDGQVVIGNGHTLTWDAAGGPILGKITLLSGGALRITAGGGEFKGQIVLAGGTLLVEGNTVFHNILLNQDSQINIAADQAMQYNGTLTIPSGKTLQFNQSGTLVIKGKLAVQGTLRPGTISLDLRGATLELGNDLSLAGAKLVSDSATTLNLTRNATLTSDQSLNLGTLALNDLALTLGSASSDLTVYNTLILDHGNEQIITGAADLTVWGEARMSAGVISSSAGNLTFSGRGTFSGGTLDAKGTALILSNSVTINGTKILADSTTSAQPLARVGANQTVQRGNIVILDGSTSLDLDGTIAFYRWIQTGGPTVVLSNASSAKASFVAPNVESPGANFTFELTVTDNRGLTGKAATTIRVLGGGKTFTGLRGDLDADGKLTGGDSLRMGQCITHVQFVKDFGASDDQADRALDIRYASDCERIDDMDNDGLLTGGDTIRLGQCVTHAQFVNDFGATETQANQALQITASSDCARAKSSW